MITACTRAAVGDPVGEISQQPLNGHWAEVILHAENAGKFDHLEISEEMRPYVVEEDLWVSPGDSVQAFDGANHAIGTLVMRFDTADRLNDAMNNISKWGQVTNKQFVRGG